jgi:hypothetical protein
MGENVLVQFKTVRFSEQPIPGLRIYFCQHLTPEYVWQQQWLMHPNQMQYLSKIFLGSPNINQTAATFERLLNLSQPALVSRQNRIQIHLPNIELIVQEDRDSQVVSIKDARLSQSLSDPVDFIIDHHFLTHH